MQQNLKLTLPLVVAMTLIAACGGGGGSSGTGTSGGNGGSGGGNGGSGGTPAAPVWTAGQFSNETQFESYCVAPRTGIDPYSGRAYPDRAGTAMHEKMWLRSWNNRTYLWYSEVADLDPTSYSIASYFNLLKTNSVTDSGAPKDQFHFSQNTAEYKQQSQSGVSSGYGIEWSVGSTTPPRSFTVAYTEPNSPAATAGIKRGDVLLEVDGVDFINNSTSSGVNTLNAALFPATLGEQHSFKFRSTDNSQLSVQIRSANVASSPVQNAKVLNTAKGKVGYFQFNSYIVPAQRQLIDAVTLFRNEAISELVVDLRYNGGGLLALASQLGYMVTGPTIIQDRFFERLQFNDKYSNSNPITGESLSPTPFYNREINFETGTLTSTALPNLNLSRIYVLTTENSCSASEAFMNGLRGIDVEVIQIGGKTCGKPYGFYPTDNCGTTYFTIQFRGVNSKGFGDYADGFRPTQAPVFAADVKGCTVTDDFSKQLGDPTEDMLQVALHHVETNSCLNLANTVNTVPDQSISSVAEAEKAEAAVRHPTASPLTNSIRLPIKDQQE